MYNRAPTHYRRQAFGYELKDMANVMHGRDPEEDRRPQIFIPRALPTPPHTGQGYQDVIETVDSFTQQNAASRRSASIDSSTTIHYEVDGVEARRRSIIDFREALMTDGPSYAITPPGNQPATNVRELDFPDYKNVGCNRAATFESFLPESRLGVAKKHKSNTHNAQIKRGLGKLKNKFVNAVKNLRHKSGGKGKNEWWWSCAFLLFDFSFLLNLLTAIELLQARLRGSMISAHDCFRVLGSMPELPLG
ncbi:hypothetical protein K458DRAFT_196033 [Lentithecium fluviatile CBS 122367]|uniref:Uncharacterized protein n=1 Tax=Lentithecium fluviatile CBS 122367 TaxID=1168545 RepID=A0A6G1IDB6_9PLEO|nr:hypothetical protein K458DRAFT_196033 [Lentithecium fluviatile CBS 122367]